MHTCTYVDIDSRRLTKEMWLVCLCIVSCLARCALGEVDEAFRRRAQDNYKKLEPCIKSAWIYQAKGQNITFEFPQDGHEHFAAVKNKLSRFKRTARVHSYRHYYGPWVENIFISHFENKPLEDFHGIFPLFVPWVDNQKMTEQIWKEIMDALSSVLRPNVIYLAVSQGDIGLAKIAEKFPNILVLSGGGFGHIPIPLIKGEIAYHTLNFPPKWDQEIGFFGNMQQASRPVMFDIIRKTADKLGVTHKIAFGALYHHCCFNLSHTLSHNSGYVISPFSFVEFCRSHVD